MEVTITDLLDEYKQHITELTVNLLTHKAMLRERDRTIETQARELQELRDKQQPSE